MQSRSVILVLWGLYCAVSVPPQIMASDRLLIGYLPDYRVDSIRVDQVARCSRVVFFSIEPTKSGQFPGDAISSEVLGKFKRITKSRNVKTSLCVGGWGKSAAFSTMTKTAKSRQEFVDRLALYCRQHGFIGVDYDWEHPSGVEELRQYTSLVVQTRLAFELDDFEVTVAQAPWQDLGQELYGNVDRVHLMSYDHDFPQATLRQSKFDVNRLIQWGCPASKIALGVPFYGRNRERESKTYAEILRQYSPTSSDDHAGGYAFNSVKSIGEKVDYTEMQKLAGVMVWEIGQDSSTPGWSLLETIENRQSGK